MPEISIVISTFNGLEMTKACVRSLEETIGARADFEVIFADDASTDETPAWLNSLPAARYRAIRHETNLGYSAANNSAAKVSRGKYLVLLNNDTVLLPNWLEAMLRVLKKAPKAGVVGSVQREVETGLIDHAGIWFTELGQPAHAGRDDVLPPRGEYSPWPAVTGACCALRRELFLALGGFDEFYKNSFEDVDLCLRARAAGFQNYVANRSLLYHHISPAQGRYDHVDRNLAYFRDRWGPMIAARVERNRIAATKAIRLREIHQHHLDDGWRYLRKHAARPWRYSAARLRSALSGVAAGLPPEATVAPDLFFRP